MSLFIQNSDTEFDQKLRTLLGYILPSSGGTLYSILDNPNTQSQTLTLDGRKVDIILYSYGVEIDFGPIIQ